LRNIVISTLLIVLTYTSYSFAAPWPNSVSDSDRAYLKELMKDTWHYIDFFISPETGFPYDSNQAKDITNTTNVGLYLTSVCMAYKLGYVSEEHAVARITKILDSLDTYGNWNRLYNNWLDPEGKNRAAKPGPNNISDYNKLPAGLIVVRRTFPQLRKRCTDFLDEIPWEKFHDAGTGRIYYEFDVAEKSMRNPVFFYRGEDKILGHFLMIASGKVPAYTWDKHDLSDEARYGYQYYKHGWQGGGLFMQFICDMFLDNEGTLLGKSSVNFTWAQILHASKIGAPVWGWSACVSPNGPYLGMGGLVDEVVTPHASVLAVSLFPSEVVSNLKRLEDYGLRTPFMVDGKPEKFGFRDSVNWKNGQTCDKYLVLDQAMLFLSLVNYCENGLLWKTFDSDEMVKYGKSVISDYKKADSQRAAQRDYIRKLSADDIDTFWIGREIWARSLSSNAAPDIKESWKVSDESGRVIVQGSENTGLLAHGINMVKEVEVPDNKEEYGTMWTFEASLERPGAAAVTRVVKVRFPMSLMLEGKWKIADGNMAEWASPDFDDSAWKEAYVPLRWEEEALKDYDGVAWYRLHFDIPAEMLKRWGDMPLAVGMGAVDDADETFLNGQMIGKSGEFPPVKKTAYDTPRIYAFDKGLLKEHNVLAVRVSDWGGNGGIWRGPVLIGPADEVRQLIGESR